MKSDGWRRQLTAGSPTRRQHCIQHPRYDGNVFALSNGARGYKVWRDRWDGSTVSEESSLPPCRPSSLHWHSPRKSPSWPLMLRWEAHRSPVLVLSSAATIRRRWLTPAASMRREDRCCRPNSGTRIRRRGRPIRGRCMVYGRSLVLRPLRVCTMMLTGQQARSLRWDLRCLLRPEPPIHRYHGDPAGERPNGSVELHECVLERCQRQ